MLLSQIEYFQAIVETQSFTKAAEKCHISQSAISQQCKALEDELGVSLLERHNRTFSLTPAGNVFYQKSQRWLKELQDICKDTVKVGRNEEATLNIGYLSCYGGNEFQNATAEFVEKYPHVKIQIMNGSHDDLYHALKDSEVDIILSDQRRAFHEDYVNMELVESKCYVQIGTTNPLSNKKEVDMKDIEDIPCVVVSTPQQQQTEKTYYQSIVGFHSEILFAQDLRTARIMVAAGKGVNVIEGIHPCEYYDRTVKMLPLMKNGMQMTHKYFAFFAKDNAGYYVEEFAELLKNQFSNEMMINQ